MYNIDRFGKVSIKAAKTKGATMTAGHLQVKNGRFYAVMNYMTARGERRQKWIPLGLTEKGNKKKAEEELIKLKLSYVPPKEDILPGQLSPDMFFCDYLRSWLEIIEKTVEKTTFNSYSMIVLRKVIPYFEPYKLKLSEVEARHIQSFYTHELRTVTGKTVINEHNLIHRALKYAVKMDLIKANPADKVDRPKKEKYIADYYRADELDKLFEATKDHPYSLLIQMTAFYGLRRGEVLGLRWDAVDFDANTITIRHVALETVVGGKKKIVFEDRAKTKSSLRTLPLVDDFKQKLTEHKNRQSENRRIAGSCYNTEYVDYIFVDPLGKFVNIVDFSHCGDGKAPQVREDYQWLRLIVADAANARLAAKSCHIAFKLVSEVAVFKAVDGTLIA